jgi:hypothetical protein
MSQTKELLIELRRRSKLKGIDSFITVRELSCPPFCMNSPTKVIANVKKIVDIDTQEHEDLRTGKKYNLYRIKPKVKDEALQKSAV